MVVWIYEFQRSYVAENYTTKRQHNQLHISRDVLCIVQNTLRQYNVNIKYSFHAFLFVIY